VLNHYFPSVTLTITLNITLTPTLTLILTPTITLSSPAKSHASRVSLTHFQFTHAFPPAKVVSHRFYFFEVSAGTVPYPLLKTLQVQYRIPNATGMGYGNFR